MWLEVSIDKPQSGTMAELHVAGKDLFITCVDGQLFCGQNYCPHEGVKLTLGCLKNQRIRCSLHGFSFDLHSGKSDESGVDNLILYPIKEEKQKIFIDV